MKFCPKCQTNKLLEDYYNSKSKPDGKRGWCKSCDNLVNRKNSKKTEYRERQRHRQYIIEYGISLDDYDQMRKAQDYCCSICGTHESKLSQRLFVDHSHDTGDVRGLLCNLCNSAIGKFKENTETMERAIGYIKNSGDPRSRRK